MAALLDLDATFCGEYLTDVPDHIAALVSDPQTIVDLGAGTGVGTVALAQRFPTGQILALDNSADLLARATQRAAAAGVGDRVLTRVADLDTTLPATVTDVDVAWASSTLHHFADPDALLRSTFSALRPGGVLVVLEIVETPTFLPPGSPEGEVESHIQPAMSAGGWNKDLDWRPAITAAGFEIVETVEIVTVTTESAAGIRDYATMWLSHLRSSLADELSEQDRTTLDLLLSEEDPSSLRRRDDLSLRARRTAWIAKRPD